ncbi:aminoglycoside phosphotransferase family protein [Paenibacillus thermotolerans]|uniref:aminoglycoside phosphotransferase family protein n=1 Tax=Paenibacillus thermotolerans TaxID=3027807 RepID=UPI002368BEE0|nr:MULTISPECIES: aminoglycoside phosphotransferase family protein [unclassified Paenibacillus]
MTIWTELEREYGISIVKPMKVRDVYRIVTKKHGHLCLKPYPIPEAEVRFIARAFAHLEEQGFDYGPKVLRTRRNTEWVTRREVHYMLTNWVRGRQPDFSGSASSEYKKAIRRLASFHKAAQGYPSSEAPESRIRYGGIPDNIASYRDTLKRHSRFGRLTELCDEAAARLKAEPVLKAIEQERAAGAFTHGDFNYPNLVLDGAGKIHLIDFENTSLSSRMQDFAHILYRNFPWQSDRMLQWIEYYDRKRPLSAEDRSLLRALLLVPYPVVRNLRIFKSVRAAERIMPSREQIRSYRRGLRELV